MVIEKAAEQAQVEQVNAAPPPLIFQEDDDDDSDDDDSDSDDDCEDENREEEVVVTSDEEDDDYYDDDKEEEEEEDDDKEEEEEEGASSSICPTLTDSPYMVLHHGIGETEQTFYSISKGIYSDRSIPMMNGMTCCASSNGWLVMLDLESCNSDLQLCLLLNWVSLEQVYLPLIKASYNFATYCILTSSPPDCVVMFLSFDDNSCLFCRPDDKRWTRKILGPKFGDDHSTGCFRVPFGAVSYQGKIYINYGHGEGMKILEYKKSSDQLQDDRIIHIGNRFTVEKIRFNKDLSKSFNRFTTSSQTSNYLVESQGEVFLVIRNHIRSKTSNTYSFSVYKLTNSSSSRRRRMAWNKVESLGDDRVFLLHQSCSLSVSASKSGLMENHIYFFHKVDPRYLYRFSMDNGFIFKTLCFPHVDAAAATIGPYWMI